MKKLSKRDKELVRNAYMAGFLSSGEGWNGEYPFNDGNFESASQKDKKKIIDSINFYVKELTK